MKKTDRKIRKKLKTDAPCVPPEFSKTFNDTLAAIRPETRRNRRKL